MNSQRSAPNRVRRFGTLRTYGDRDLLSALFRWTLLPAADRSLTTDSVWMSLRQVQKAWLTEVVRVTAAGGVISTLKAETSEATRQLVLNVLMTDGILRVWAATTLADHQSALTEDLIAVERLVVSLSRSQQQLMTWAYRVLQGRVEEQGFADHADGSGEGSLTQMNLLRKRLERWMDILIACSATKLETAIEWGYDGDCVEDFSESFSARKHPLATVMQAGWEQFLTSLDDLRATLPTPFGHLVDALSGPQSISQANSHQGVVTKALSRLYFP